MADNFQERFFTQHHDFLKIFMQISGVVALEPKFQIKKTDENIK
jgi:hypothetical protein